MIKQKHIISGLALTLTAILTGCCCTDATFSEGWYQTWTNDPAEVSIVQPNDTIIDPMAAHVKEKQNDWTVTVSVVPAEEADASLQSIGGGNYYKITDVRQHFVDLGGQISQRFGVLRNFKIVGDAASDPSGVTEVRSGAPNRLTYNLSQLSCQFHRGQYHEAVWINGHRIRDAYRDPDFYTASVGVQVKLLHESGKQRFAINADGKASGGTPSEAISAAISNAVNNVMLQYGMNFAPPIHVTMMHGDGLFAQISAGEKDGVVIGTPIRFIQFVQLGKIGNKDNIQENQIASGIVVKIDDDTAWVKVDHYHYKVVHIGTLAKIGQ